MVLSKQELKNKIQSDYQNYCNFGDDFPVESHELLRIIKKDLQKYIHYYIPPGLKRGKTGFELLSILSIQFLGLDISIIINKNKAELGYALDPTPQEFEIMRKASSEKIRKFYQLCQDLFDQYLLSGDYYNRNFKELDSIFFSVHKEHLPSTFRGMISLLGGDPNKSSSCGYIKALLRGEEKGKQYLTRQRDKVISPKDIKAFFNQNPEFYKYLGYHSYMDNYEIINKAFRRFYQNTHNVNRVNKNLPKTLDGLSSALGGPRKNSSKNGIMSLLDTKQQN